MTQKKSIPLAEIQDQLTDEALRLIKEAQSECFIYKKSSVVSTFLLLSFLKNNFNLGIPPDKIRQLVAPSAEEPEADPPISMLVVDAIQHGLSLRSTFMVSKCDNVMLLLGFLSLQKGTHLDLFKQFNVDRIYLYNQYMRNYLIQRLTSDSAKSNLSVGFSLLTTYILLADKMTQGKLDQIMSSITKKDRYG